jgi:hypothetical protein
MPERVAWVIENRCATCHSDTSAKFGRLDLTKWVETPDGGYGFVHLDASKKQRPSRDTFETLLERVTSSDPDEFMPVGDVLKPEDLDALVEWLKAGPQRS